MSKIEEDFKRATESGLKYLTIKDLEKEIKSIKESGIDKIQNMFLIHSSKTFKQMILALMNETLKQNYIPKIWKVELVTKIPKKK
jgi:hypothetical protein